MKKCEKIELFGVKIDNLSKGLAVERALHSDEPTCRVVTPNAVMLDACRRDPALAELLRSATLSLADGMGVLLLARRQGTPLCERVAGIDFAEALLARAAQDGLRVFLLGGAQGVAEAAAKRLSVRYPALCICGTHHGYFASSNEDAAVTAEICASKADILFVCMGFPRQESWIAAHLSQLANVRVAVGLGGSIDVWAGRVKRAPRVLSKIGLEWAWRMILEPKRLLVLPALIRTVLYLPPHRAYDLPQKEEKPNRNA